MSQRGQRGQKASQKGLRASYRGQKVSQRGLRAS